MVSASYRRIQEARELAAWLIAQGHTVTSRWLAADAQIGKEYVHCDEAMAAFSDMDLEDVEASEALVMLCGDPPDLASRGGRHAELGWALRVGKKCFLLGFRQGVHDWNKRVKCCRTRAELLEALK